MEEPGIQQLLRDLERALAEAIADSPALGDGLRRIQEEGYDVQVVFDCKARASEAQPPRAPRRRSPQPSFRIHGDDLAFLRSIGIDPTRRKRSS